jgi:hypothetical protein
MDKEMGMLEGQEFSLWIIGSHGMSIELRSAVKNFEISRYCSRSSKVGGMG